MKQEIEFISDALNILCPNGFSYNGEEITAVSDPVPTQEELDAQIAILKAEYATQEYARNRASEYPSTGDQLDKIYHNGLTKWKSEMVDPVKAKWPKDNSGPV